jgi:acyl carrier protein
MNMKGKVFYMLFKKVAEIIAEQLDYDNVDEITPETSLMNDLEADSLDAVEVIMALEDEFDVEIPDEDAENFKNIGDIAKYIEEKTK